MRIGVIFFPKRSHSYLCEPNVTHRRYIKYTIAEHQQGEQFRLRINTVIGKFVSPALAMLFLFKNTTVCRALNSTSCHKRLWRCVSNCVLFYTCRKSLQRTRGCFGYISQSLQGTNSRSSRTGYMSKSTRDCLYLNLTCPPKSQKVSLQPPTSILPTVVAHTCKLRPRGKSAYDKTNDGAYTQR